jgi:uncharacterized protein involved in response to NO
MSELRRHHTDEGMALLRQGFRPFFLAAALWAVVAVGLWMSVHQGLFAIPTAFDAITWHVHEMVFGFVAAAMAGFLLTAVPNWTGRLPLRGTPLLGLLALWVLGRIAVIVSIETGPILAAALDLAFPAMLLALVLREILAGRNWRNLVISALLALLLVANLCMHLDAAGWFPTSALGQRLGFAAVVLILNLVGGRIVPSFTRNWLVKRGERRLPASFDVFDRVQLAILFVALAGWVGASEHPVTGAALITAGLASVFRLVRWRGYRTFSEPLVWSLHLGFAWMPVGLILIGTSIAGAEVPQSSGLHALSAGGFAAMILAIMTRATLGHTGRDLRADKPTTAIYLLAFSAAVTRVAAAFQLEVQPMLLWASVALWILAFGLFAVVYGRLLFSR